MVNRPLRIGFEANELSNKNPSGVARYVSNLLGSLRGLGQKVDPLLRVSRINRRRRVITNGGHHPRWVFPPFLPLCSYDILHLTASRPMSVSRVKRTVVTVHDLWEYRLHAAGELATLPESCLRVAEALSIADGALCVSESTAHDLRTFFPAFKGPIAVTHLGVSSAFHRPEKQETQAIRQRYGLGDADYLLYVGHHHVRKNIQRMIEAYALLPPDVPRLILAGNSDVSRRDEVTALAHRLGVGSRVLQFDYVPEQDLAPLIGGARLSVFVPLFEGFGLPLLEAYRCGTPVVTSRNSSLLELAHPSSALVDPLSLSDIARGIMDMLSVKMTEDARAALCAHAANFTWERCAQTTQALYYKVME